MNDPLNPLTAIAFEGFKKRLTNALKQENPGDEPAILYCAVMNGWVMLTTMERVEMANLIVNRPNQITERYSTGWIWGALQCLLLEQQREAA